MYYNFDNVILMRNLKALHKNAGKFLYVAINSSRITSLIPKLSVIQLSTFTLSHI